MYKIKLLLVFLFTFSTAVANAQDVSNAYILKANNLSAEDELALRGLIARANHAVDMEDYDLYLSFFASDAVMDSGFGPPVEGRKAMRETLDMSRPFISGKRHVAANLVITGEGDTAQVVSYLTVFERNSSLTFQGSAVITDDLEKREGRWVITRHQTRMDPATIAAMQAVQQ